LDIFVVTVIFLSSQNVANAAVAYGSRGNAASSGTTLLSVPYPGSIAAGDLLILVVGNKYPTNGPATPAGWTFVANGQGSGGLGSAGVDSGQVYNTIFVKEALGNESGNLAVTVTSANTSMARMFRYTKTAGTTWDYAATNGSDNSAGTSWSVTGAANPGITPGDVLIIGSSLNGNRVSNWTESIFATGATFGAVTERNDSTSATGDDMGLIVSEHTVTAGTASAAPVFTMTGASGSANATSPTGASAILRIREVVPPVNCTSQVTGNWSASSTWMQCRGGIPLAGDGVTIANTHNVTLNVNTPTLTTLTINSGGTLTNTGSNTITLGGAMNNAGTYTGGSGAITVGGSFTNTGSYSAGSATITLKGNFSNSGTLTAGTGTWVFSGSSAQSLTGVTSFNNLTVNNANGVSFNNNVSVGTLLTLTNGHISTGGNILTLSADCSTPSWSRGSGFVAGNLRLNFPSGTITCTYPVGSDSNYAPISLTMVSAGGTLTGSTTGYEHPAIAFSTIDPTLDANRYWTLGAADDTVTATSYGVTVNFQTGDLDINAVPANFIVGKYASGVWTMPTSTSGTSSSTASNISGPITIPTDFAVGQIPVPCTVPSGLPSNMSCVCDNFGRSNLNPSTIYGADWLVDNKNQASTFGNPRIVNSGKLQLTDNSGGVSTVANVPGTFPAAGNLIVVEFKHYAYHGTGADGIALTLSDSTKTPTPGAFGGSLGYAQKDTASDCATAGGCLGFNGGWVGVAIDEFGNFSANTEGRTGGSAPGQRPDSVAVRGSGSGLAGYPYLGGSATLSPGIDNAGSTAAAYGHQYRITVDARNYTWNGSTGAKTTTVAVDRDTFTGSGYQPVVSSFDAFIVNPSQALVPANWKLSFTGSTGGFNNIHEISGLKICAQTITPPAGYRIQVDNLSPSNCTDAANGKSIVTVTALDNSGNTLTGYTSPVTLVARIGSSSGSVSSTVTWTSLASNNGVWDAANKRYTFSANDHGVAKFQLTNSATEDIYIVVSESVSGSTLASSLITPVQFSGGAFSVSALDSLNTGVVAGRPHLMRITRTNGCGTDTTYSGLKTLDSWYTPTTFDHPAGAIAPQICATNASGTCQPAGGSCQVQSIAPPAVSSNSNNLSITFANGNADFCLVTSDVGKYTISVRDDSNMSLPITGSGSTLTARPLALYFNSVTQGFRNNPKSTTDSFISAGDTFEGVLSALLWTSALDPGYTGMPTVTPQENAAAWSAALLSSPPTFAWPTTLSIASVVNPSGGDGALNSPIGSYSLAASAYTNGHAVLPANSLSIDNVGSFLLTETVSNYLNTSGATVPAYSDVIGRFYLDHFELSSGTVSAACNGYTYMGQPNLGIAFTLRAENKNNGRATNYAMTPTVTLVAEDQGTGNTGYDLGSRISGVTGTWTADDYSFSALSAIFSRPDTPGPITGGAENAAGPFDQLQLGVQAIDPDGARIQGLNMRATTQGNCTTATSSTTDCDAKVIGTTKIRLGRISLQNASGSELLDLPVPLTAEYWNGNSWVTNTEDSCTALIAPANGSGLGLHLANNGATTATLSNPLISGDAGLSLSAPGVTHTGYVVVTIDSPAWLDFKWDGVTDSDPISRATFGIYKGNSKFIYIRERY
jgi:MSHA biogenesis protein MshQ